MDWDRKGNRNKGIGCGDFGVDYSKLDGWMIMFGLAW